MSEKTQEENDKEARRKAALKVARKAPAGSGARERAVKDAAVYRPRKRKWI